MAHEKPFSFNTAVDQQRTAQIDNAGLDRFAASGRAITFPLVMASATTAPVPVVAGNTKAVRYARMNNWVNLWFSIDLGTGSTFGGATWRMSVPGPLAGATARPLNCRGGWMVDYDGTGAAVKNGWTQITTQSGSWITFPYLNTAAFGAVSYIGSGAPWVWDGMVGAVLSGFVTYEIQDLYY